MFDHLRSAIEALEVPVDDRAVLAVLALRDRLDARVSAAIGDFDAAELWDLDGSSSMTAWLKRHGRMVGSEAKRASVTASRIRRCPTVRAAWEDGALSSGQVAVIVANVTDRTVDLFVEHEAALVPLLVPLDLRDTTMAMQAWAVRAEATLDDEEPPAPPVREAHLSKLLDGCGHLDASLDPEGLQLAVTALRLAESKDAEGEERTPSHRRGDALVDIFRYFLDHQRVKLGGRHRPHLNVIVDADDHHAGRAGRTADGTPIDGATIRQIACDANVHRIIREGRSSILDVGRATRTIPPALYTALVVRDVGCRFPGCDRTAEWTEGHHIVHWEDDGPTCLSNLVLLCSRHHHVIHQRGWSIELLPDGRVRITEPRGRVHTTDPPLLRSPSAA